MVCKKIIEITANFRVVEKRMILGCIFGGQPGPRNFIRWVAVGFLLPEAVQELDWVCGVFFLLHAVFLNSVHRPNISNRRRWAHLQKCSSPAACRRRPSGYGQRQTITIFTTVLIYLVLS
jgi:hypothetical protein